MCIWPLSSETPLLSLSKSSFRGGTWQLGYPHYSYLCYPHYRATAHLSVLPALNCAICTICATRSFALLRHWCYSRYLCYSRLIFRHPRWGNLLLPYSCVCFGFTPATAPLARYLRYLTNVPLALRMLLNRFSLLALPALFALPALLEPLGPCGLLALRVLLTLVAPLALSC